MPALRRPQTPCTLATGAPIGSRRLPCAAEAACARGIGRPRSATASRYSPAAPGKTCSPAGGSLMGAKCVPWNFPSGGCPADDSAVFRTVHECRTQCLGQLGRSPCGPPRAIACDQRHLKYPFFADSFTSDGRLRCLRSSPSVLRDRRCLTGANRFHTREACMVTCENRPTS
ncbi:hypothetical protein MRX96_035059 [Rhipicephalus microplus]